MSGPIRVRAQRSNWRESTDVLVSMGNDAVVMPMVFTKVEPGSVWDPTIGGSIDGRDIGEEFLRAALNCAWDLGLRPDGFNDTRESMKATDAHLQDMRALAFHKIGAEKPA